MAIVQISRITQRKGLSENLPQLSGAEFGWVIDQRRLFIGNGTLQEGAPSIGNTEILTQYSDIFAIAGLYTYKGEAGGYTVQTGPTSGDPVQRTLQAKLDDFASVKDFGATGDGTTDDTDAINRALYQLFCRENNVQVRRSLFFPAGTYRVTSPILVPPYAKLYGEGGSSSIIQLDVGGDSAYGNYVMQTADSDQQTGVNIGNNGAATPTNIELYNMGFYSNEEIDLVLIEDASDMLFQDCNFIGPFTQTYIEDNPGLVTTADISCVKFLSSAAVVTNQITFDACRFSGMTYAFNEDENIQGITVQNSKFDTLYQGVLLGTGTPVSGGPVGFRLMHNLFDAISQEGIVIDNNVQNNMSGYNMFLDVGNDFQGLGSPVSPVIILGANNNVSVGDMFERDETDNLTEPRIDVGTYQVFALDKGQRYKFGTYRRNAGGQVELDVTSTSFVTTGVEIDVTNVDGLAIQYTYKDAISLSKRTGTITVAPDDGVNSVTWTEDYVEVANNDLTFEVQQSGDTVELYYKIPTGGAGSGGNFKYSISYFE